MNLYFLVEGRRTERKVYPAWLTHLLPHFSQVERFTEARDKNFFMFSGEGYPALLDEHLPNAIRDCNKVRLYDFLILCLDADESSPAERIKEIAERIKKNKIALTYGELKVIVQNRTIESWFLGNRCIISRAPQNARLAEFIRYYDVSALDPEAMGCAPGFANHAQFHHEYLREAFHEKGITYTKRAPRHVCDPQYLDQLLARIREEKTHLKTFQTFIEFCRYVAAMTGRPPDA